jgi:hypothetical protein
MKKIILIFVIFGFLYSCKEEEFQTTNENDIVLVVKNEYEVNTEVTTRADISKDNKIKVVAYPKENYTLSSKEIFSCYFISNDGENYILKKKI